MINNSMTPATERWINEELSRCGLGPVSRDDDFWAQMWSHCLNAAEGSNPQQPKEKARQHTMARYGMVRAIELMYYGHPLTMLPGPIVSGWAEVTINAPCATT